MWKNYLCCNLEFVDGVYAGDGAPRLTPNDDSNDVSIDDGALCFFLLIVVLDMIAIIIIQFVFIFLTKIIYPTFGV